MDALLPAGPPLAPLRLERQSGTAGLAVISMQRVDVRQLDVERQPDLTGAMFGCGECLLAHKSGSPRSEPNRTLCFSEARF